MAKKSKSNDPMALAISELNGAFGEGTIGKIYEISANVDRFPTGSLVLDDIVGGGWPIGRIIEVFGPESSGKTTICLHAVREAQRRFPDKKVVYVDAEQALDPWYAKGLGVNMDEMILAQPSTGEQGLTIAEKTAATGQASLVLIDSVAALTPQKQLEGDIGDANVGIHAKMMSQSMMKIVNAAQANNTTIIFTNQLREKIGVMFGSPEYTPGGRALPFYASIRLDVRRSAQIKNGDQVIGNITKLKTIKNKTAPPFQRAETPIYYGFGIYRPFDTIAAGEKLGIIQRSGSWYSAGDTKLGQGQQGAAELLLANDEYHEELRGYISEAIKSKYKQE